MTAENSTDTNPDNGLLPEIADPTAKTLENGNKLERQVSFKIDQTLSDDIDQAVKERNLEGQLTDRTNYMRYVVGQHREFFHLRKQFPILSDENSRLSDENIRLKIGGNLPISQENPDFAALANPKAFIALKEAVKVASKDISEMLFMPVSSDFLILLVEDYYKQILPQIS